jgi:Zn finger protein HypA/HybF involved in hydrogenase expression
LQKGTPFCRNIKFLQKSAEIVFLQKFAEGRGLHISAERAQFSADFCEKSVILVILQIYTESCALSAEICRLLRTFDAILMP